jgi:exopolyphosphatase/pppGpp-phosphohydrolase
MRLGAGLDARERAHRDRRCERALACLRRFGAELQGLFHLSVVRAVSTQTLREAAQPQRFS